MYQLLVCAPVTRYSLVAASSEHGSGSGLTSGAEGSPEAEAAKVAAAAAALARDPTACALADAADAAHDALLDRLTIAIPGTSYVWGAPAHHSPVMEPPRSSYVVVSSMVPNFLFFTA